MHIKYKPFLCQSQTWMCVHQQHVLAVSSPETTSSASHLLWAMCPCMEPDNPVALLWQKAELQIRSNCFCSTWLMKPEAQVWAVTYDRFELSLMTSLLKAFVTVCRLTTTDTFPVRKIPLWLLFSHQGKQQYHCGYFPFPVESHQTILSFSPAWLLSEWLDNYFFPKNQRAPNSQQSAGSQHCPGWLWDLHQRLHRCLLQLPQVWQKGFPKACSQEHMKINSLRSKRSH